MRNTLLAMVAAIIVLNTGWASEPYDFRASDAYRSLSKDDRTRLEQVHRDLMMLWGALDRYADGHDGNPPKKLDDLVPGYLAELPNDPFATEKTRKEKPTHWTSSKGGWGYQYTKGPMYHRKGQKDDRAWMISSVGLPKFPYNAETGNIGLYVCKGIWF